MQTETVESGIEEHEQRVMHDLLTRERPEMTAEIGCANGASTHAIAQALQRNDCGHHFAVDPLQDSLWKNAGKHRISAANLTHRVTFHDDYPEHVFSQLPKLDFVFIDGSHMFDLTILDFVVSDRRLKVGGLMAFHDSWLGSVQTVLRFILGNRDYEPYRVGLSSRRLSRWRQFRQRAAVRVASLIAGRADLIAKRVPFERLGFDRSNLVFIRKTGEDTRHWKFFNEF